jgi:peptide/nickel transport system substrate-binding protein
MSRFKKLILGAVAAIAISAPASAETLRWGGRADIYSLDPDSIASTFNLSFLNHIYEGLVRYDANFKIEPALATKWELIDNKVWRFTLRQGVKFHNGADFTADDVIASLNRVTDPASPLRGNIPLYVSSK